MDSAFKHKCISNIYQLVALDTANVMDLNGLDRGLCSKFDYDK